MVRPVSFPSAFPRAGKSEMRGSLSKSSFATASPVVPSFALSQRIWRTGMRFESPSAGVTEVVTPAIGARRLAIVSTQEAQTRISAS